MNSPVEKAVLNQFAQAVAAVATCPVDLCNFVHVRNLGHVMQVTYEWKDACCRCQHADAYIDITDICLEDLCDPKWSRYIHGLAVSFEKLICVRPFPECHAPKYRCLEQPEWTAYPCTVTRVIELPPVVCKPKCVTVTQVVSRTCECVTVCPECPNGVQESYVPDLCRSDSYRDDCHRDDYRREHHAPKQEWRPTHPIVQQRSTGCGCG